MPELSSQPCQVDESNFAALILDLWFNLCHQVDVFLEELDCVEPTELAAVVGRQQRPLEAGGAARQPALPRLLALAAASSAVIGLVDSPDKARAHQLPLQWGRSSSSCITRNHSTL